MDEKDNKSNQITSIQSKVYHSIKLLCDIDQALAELISSYKEKYPPKTPELPTMAGSSQTPNPQPKPQSGKGAGRGSGLKRYNETLRKLRAEASARYQAEKQAKPQ